MQIILEQGRSRGQSATYGRIKTLNSLKIAATRSRPQSASAHWANLSSMALGHLTILTLTRNRQLVLPAHKYLCLLNRASMQQQHQYSTADQEEVISSLDPQTGIASIKWNNLPVNCLSMKLIKKSIKAIRNLEQDTRCTALILTSNIPNTFCAGLDFKEIHRPQRDQLFQYNLAFGKLWTALYSTRLVTVAALNGSTPAGGCVVALGCDYRIMKNGKGTIGLSEVHLGIPIRSWIAEIYVDVIGRRQAELAITRGTLFTPEEALKIGLVDELVANDEELLKQATHQAQLLASVPSEARHKAKMELRWPLLERMESMKEVHANNITDNMMDETLQRNIEAYMERLKKKK